MSRASDRSREVKYVYDLPYLERKQLCNILDSDNSWEKLGGMYMELKWCDLDEYRRAERCGDSPTNRLLQVWGQQNHTVNELFLLLWQMEHFRAMRVLKSCVSVKYHKLFTDAERRTTGIFCEKSRPVGGVVVVRNSQESERVIRPSSNNTQASVLETSISNHNNSTLGTSPRVIHNNSVLGASARPTSSTKQQTLSVHTRQQPQSQKDDADGMTEGACALVSPLYNYDSHNLNHGASDSSSHPVSPKVPETFLYPTCTTPSTVKARPSLANQQRHRLVPNHGSTLETDKKINNNEINGAFAEVSCEDNNAEELKTILKASHYDPEKDYIEKLKEKGEKEAARLAGASDVTRSTNTTGGVSVTKTEPPLAVCPLQNPQGQIMDYPGAERHRKISNASDSSSHSTSVPVIPYKELEEATALWSRDHLLGRGGFGTVYKGNWKNTEVAIKRIEPHGSASLDNTRLHITQSLEELKLLQSYRHDNILQVYGCSTDHELSPCLVYQFMPNGSLEDRLQCRKIEAFGEGPPLGATSPLTWLQRFRIAWGTARALQFLHTVKEKPLIHGDVKSANILLDQNYEPKLGDFGLAREGKSQSTSMKVSRVHGTKPYLPSDYLRSKKLSVKVDTYSYGIVLFEMCTGLRAYDEKRKEGEKFLKELVDDTSDKELLRDKNGVGPDDGVFKFLFDIGKRCVEMVASQRPDMETVFNELRNYSLVLEQIAQARKISHGETVSVVSSPHMLQLCYDTAKSLQSPSLSPTTQPSLPHFIHPSSSPSAATMHPAYQSPPSPSIIPPRSPVPPILPSNSPIPPHYTQRPAVHANVPGLVANGSLAYHPRRLHFGAAPSWQQGTGGNMVYGMSPTHPVGPQFHSPHMSRDPPSYSETISQGPVGAVGGMVGVSPVIPELSGLCINEGHSKVSSNGSESSQSDLGYSDTSLTASTTQNVSTVNGSHMFPQRTVTETRLPAVIPTVITQHQETSIRETGAASALPLLTELGNSSISESPSSLLSNSPKKPSAAKKKLSLFG